MACTDVPFIPVSHKAPWLAGVKQITQVEHLILHVPLFSNSCLIYSTDFAHPSPTITAENTEKNEAEARKLPLQDQNLQKRSASANKAEMLKNKTLIWAVK